MKMDNQLLIDIDLKATGATIHELIGLRAAYRTWFWLINNGDLNKKSWYKKEAIKCENDIRILLRKGF